MISAAKKQKPTGRDLVRSLGYDFALLGLNAREARSEVIREAAASIALRIQQAASEQGERDAMLSDLATSTYRLLDPRRREKHFERIQLSIFGEPDFARQQEAREPLIPSLVPATLVDPTSEHQQLDEAKREIVRLLKEGSHRRRRVGAVTCSLLTVFVCTLASLVLAIAI
jgi:hypothetical protein